MSKQLRRFCWVAWFEGVSYLLLFFVAMPLKYWFGMPLFVRIVGSAHGALFVLYMILLGQLAVAGSLRGARIVHALLASVIPGGTFWLEAQLKRDAASAA